MYPYLNFVLLRDKFDWEKLPFSYEELTGFLFKLLSAVIVIIMAFIGIALSKGLVRRLIKPVKLKDGALISEKRANTLQSVLESLFKYSIYFIAAYIILSELAGSSVRSVFNALAAAAGVALGLGAQGLIKDVIAGFFMIFEGQISLGDMVEIESKTGTVESIGLRNIKIKAFTGEIHIIPNGSIGIVTNWQKNTATTFLKFYVPYEVNIDEVLEIIENELEIIGKDEIEGLVKKPALLGIGDLQETNIQLVLSAEALTPQRFAVERALRLRIKRRFEKEGIKPPYKFGGK